ncbi:protein S100-A13-like [Pelodytes ibericus]
MAANPTEIEQAILTIVKIFFEFARAEGKCETLTMAEFTKLVTMELPHLMKDVSLEEKIKELDINKDKELTFSEYWKLIGELSKLVKEEVKGKKN